jgi:hypothetical protein
MLMSRDKNAEHPYLYAKVLGIHHLEVKHKGPDCTTSDTLHMEVLRVRWYDLDTKAKAGFKAKRLFRVSLANYDDPTSYGFVDPTDVVRGVHLIPAFALGKVEDVYDPSIVPRPQTLEAMFADSDAPMFLNWKYWYIGM